MHRSRNLGISSSVLLLSVLFISCDGSETGNDNALRRFATFNTGLNGWLLLTEERRPAVLDALEQLEVDALCLVALFNDEDVDEITARLEHKLPYAHQEKTSDSSEKKVKCEEVQDLLALQKCYQDSCIPNGLSVSDCVVIKCKEQWESLSDECRYCLSAQSEDQIACGVGGAQDYGVKGRNGLLLLSRYPLGEVRYSGRNSTLLKQGVLSATIKNTEVHCTMLPSVLPHVPYPDHLTPFSSWTEEHRAAVEQTIEVASPDRCAVLLGDLEAGPAGSNLEAVLGDSYQLLLDAGFEEPWSERQCTFCRDNQLIRPEADTQLDHALIRNCPGYTSPRYSRILDGPITVTDRMGTEQKTRLSSHYGLMLEISEP